MAGAALRHSASAAPDSPGRLRDSAKKEWPAGRRRLNAGAPSDLPRHMEGGPQNPLGARAMYLALPLSHSRLQRTMDIGTNVSSVAPDAQ